MRGALAAAMMAPWDRRGPIPDKKGMNVVNNLTAPAARRIGQIAAVGAVALVLTAAVASPSEARRNAAQDGANLAISYCFNQGGNPDADVIRGTIYVSCSWEDGTIDILDFPDE